ncbi:MAG: S-layer homology domain-containing protein [Candidatus Margulisiibacteriota bacterium]
MRSVKLYLLIFIIIALALTAYAEIDPGVIGQPARAQAMGLSTIAFENDINNLFQNPAGIEHDGDFQAVSMYSKMMEDVDYILLGVSFPVSEYTLGLGINSITAADVYYAESFDSQTGNPNMTSSEYRNDLIQVTVARTFYPWIPLSVGGSLKYLRQGIMSDPALSGSGFGMDIGAIYDVMPNIAVGVAYKNVYSSFSWGTGTNETLDKVLSAGLNTNWLNDNLNVSGKIEYNRDLSDFLLSLGVEYHYPKFLSLRAGYKDCKAVDADNAGAKSGSITLGTGLRFGNYSLDYAYVPYYTLNEDTKHYLSIAYLPLQTRKEEYSVDLLGITPFIYDTDLLIKGIANKNIVSVIINGKDAKRDKDNFSGSTELAFGANDIKVNAQGRSGKKYADNKTIVRLKKLNDLPDDYKKRMLLDLMYTYDIIQADDSGNFSPMENIERSSFVAAFMKLKGKVMKVYYQQRRSRDYAFRVVSDLLDFDSRDWAAEFMAQARKDQIIIGYPDNTIRQKEYITRAEAMTIVSRFEELLTTENVKQRKTNNEVSWVKNDHWAYPHIKALANEGYLDYIDENRKFIVKYIFTEDEREDFNIYFIEQYKVITNTKSVDLYDALETPEGRELFFEYIKELNFIKRPINKIELVEMLSRTSLFDNFLQDLGFKKML